MGTFITHKMFWSNFDLVEMTNLFDFPVLVWVIKFHRHAPRTPDEQNSNTYLNQYFDYFYIPL